MPQPKPLRRAEKDTAISLEIESATKAELEKISHIEDRSVSSIVREAIRDFLKNRKTVAA